MKRINLYALVGVMTLTFISPLKAQTIQTQPSNPVTTPPPAVQEKLADRERHERELQRLEHEAKAASDVKARLEQELALLKEDRARLNTALLETSKRVRDAEERLTSAEIRLRTLTTSEEGLRRSLHARRDIIGDVLAALQRMGRRPPPAVLVSPDDMLSSVRSAILLGAVLPELWTEAQALVTDLSEMVRLREALAREREDIGRDMVVLSQERNRLASLIEARQDAATQSEKSVSEQTSRVQTLALQSKDIRELMLAIDKELAVFNRSLDESRRFQDSMSRDIREKLASAALKDPARLAPKAAFSDMRGLLPLPVSGTMIKPYGTPDGYGSITRGITLVTRPKALVSAPSDGWVVYAGPFRSFGQLLILNAGGGYYILLAGMERMNVSLGQFVLAGEPLGSMGEKASLLSDVFGAKSESSNEQLIANTSASASSPQDPVVYIEFRKDGTSIDPSPWWTKSVVKTAKERT